VVHALALQDDAKILVAGLLTEVDGVPRGGIIRLNRDGTLDTSFNASASANGVIRALAVLPGGNVLLAGHFTQLGGVAVGRIARLAGDFRPPNPDPLRLGSTSVSGVTARKLQFEVAGDVGRSYTVEFSEDLEVWRTLTNFVSVEANTVVPDPLLIDWPRRFYRVLTPR